MTKKGIFIAATGQNIGKTTLCLGIISGLKKKFKNIGFIKPVGQRHVNVGQFLDVDEDVVLFKEYFNLNSNYSDMSPIIIPQGFTRSFFDQKMDPKSFYKKITTSYETISKGQDFTIVEGTGHVGVGSIIETNNVKVASELGLDMVIIVSGGLGSAIDKLALNISMCQSYGVKIRGIILNRVQEDKQDMIKNYFPKALKQWGVPLIGCIPFSPILSTFSMNNFETLFNTKMLAGENSRFKLYEGIRLVAGSLKSYHQHWKPNQLIITPASREDVIISLLERHLVSQIEGDESPIEGMILTGTEPLDDWLLEQIKFCHVPTLYAPYCSYDVMKRVTNFIGKIKREDFEKVKNAIEIVENNVDFSFFN